MTDEMRKQAYAIAEHETGEWGSRDATSGGPPITWEVNHMHAYTVTNLIILHDAIVAEIARRTEA